MEISFASKAVERLCSNERQATKALGAPSSRKLRARLADLAAAETVDDLVTGRLHALSGDRAGQYALDLAGGHRLVFRIASRRPSQVEIVFIGDYHG